MNIILYGTNDVNSLIETLERSFSLFYDDLDIRKIIKNQLMKECSNQLHLRFFKNKKFNLWIENTKETTIDSYLKDNLEYYVMPNFIKTFRLLLNKLYYCKNNLMNFSVTLSENEIDMISDSKHWLETKLKKFVVDEVRYFHIRYNW
ncbi:MAG: hypothetical protein KC589_06205 [Nanoarchaeota archaeon]|nr:hypothetical protein [Nanoarchaeota archaeon]